MASSASRFGCGAGADGSGPAPASTLARRSTRTPWEAGGYESALEPRKAPELALSKCWSRPCGGEGRRRAKRVGNGGRFDIFHVAAGECQFSRQSPVTMWCRESPREPLRFARIAFSAPP